MTDYLPTFKRAKLSLLAIGLTLLVACGAQPTSPPSTASPAQSPAAAASSAPANTPAAAISSPVPANTQSGTAAFQDSGTVNIAVLATQEPWNLDPHIQTGREIAEIENMYEGLVHFKGETIDVEPRLAASWDISPDGLTYTFHLRQNVKFHDGSIFNADAVKANFDRVNSIALSPAYPLMKAYLKELKIADPNTVVMTLNPGGPPFLQLMTMVLIVSPKALAANDKGGKDFSQAWAQDHEAGTGPYQIVDKLPNSRMTMKKFDDYWGGWSGPHFGVVQLLVVPEPTTQQLMLQRGELDLAQNISTEGFKQLKSDPNIQVLDTKGNRVDLLRFNYIGGPTKDVRVRKALAYAFDYQGYLTTLGGTVGPNTGPIPDMFMDGWTPTNLPTYDLAKAKSLLADAGFGSGLNLSVVVAQGADPQVKAAQILAAGLKQIGVNLDIRQQQSNAYFADFTKWATDPNRKPDAAPEDIFNIVVPPRIPDAWGYLFYNYAKDAQAGSGRNWGLYSNTKVEDILSKASLLPDPKARTEQYKLAASQIMDDQPDIFYGNEERVTYLRSDIKGYVFHPAWFPEINAYTLYRQK